MGEYSNMTMPFGSKSLSTNMNTITSEYFQISAVKGRDHSMYVSILCHVCLLSSCSISFSYNPKLNNN